MTVRIYILLIFVVIFVFSYWIWILNDVEKDMKKIETRERKVIKEVDKKLSKKINVNDEEITNDGDFNSKLTNFQRLLLFSSLNRLKDKFSDDYSKESIKEIMDKIELKPENINEEKEDYDLGV